MLRLIATIWKCQDYLLEMSGILDTRILTYCNPALKTRAYKWWSEPANVRISQYLRLSVLIKFFVKDKCITLALLVPNEHTVGHIPWSEAYLSFGCTKNKSILIKYRNASFCLIQLSSKLLHGYLCKKLLNIPKNPKNQDF